MAPPPIERKKRRKLKGYLVLPDLYFAPEVFPNVIPPTITPNGITYYYHGEVPASEARNIVGLGGVYTVATPHKRVLHFSLNPSSPR